MKRTFEFVFELYARIPVCVLLLSLALIGCGNKSESKNPPTATGTQNTQTPAAFLTRKVEQVTDGVYVAIGYGLANSVLIEGEDGVVVVDAMEGRPQAQEVKAAFEAITPKPVKALILTHNHADHVFGGSVFTEERDTIPVYAHETTSAQLDKTVSVISNATYVRSMRMFGQALPQTDAVDCGIGPRLDYHPENIALARPTHTFRDSLEIVVSGVRLVLLHAPGETPDQIIVWLPDKKVLIPADNVYQAFPNLYTIRGTAYRDVMLWVESIDKMRDLEAKYLVPCHTGFLAGKEAIAETLTAYRDAIQFVHDQTVRQINKGLTPDQIVSVVRLPAHLAQHPWLQERYGSVEWSVRGIYNGYLGWFDGDAARLRPLEPTERARRYAKAFTTGRPLAEQAQAALQGKDYQWGAELSRLWIQAEPGSQEAKNTLADCLGALGRAETNANARNYYLTQAAELKGVAHLAPPDMSSLPDDFVDGLPIDVFMRVMPTRLDCDKAATVNLRALFHFSDVNADYAVCIRNGVAEVRERTLENPDMRIDTTATTWKRLALHKTSPAMAYASGGIRLEGGVIRVVKFLGLFGSN